MLELTAQVALRLYPWHVQCRHLSPPAQRWAWCAQAPGLLIRSPWTGLSEDPERSIEMWCVGSALICFDSA